MNDELLDLINQSQYKSSAYEWFILDAYERIIILSDQFEKLHDRTANLEMQINKLHKELHELLLKVYELEARLSHIKAENL